MYSYRFLTDEGVIFLREYLNLPSDVVPATQMKSAKPLERGSVLFPNKSDCRSPKIGEVPCFTQSQSPNSRWKYLSSVSWLCCCSGRLEETMTDHGDLRTGMAATGRAGLGMAVEAVARRYRLESEVLPQLYVGLQVAVHLSIKRDGKLANPITQRQDRTLHYRFLASKIWWQLNQVAANGERCFGAGCSLQRKWRPCIDGGNQSRA